MSAPTEHVPDVRHFLDPATLQVGDRITVYPSARTGRVESIEPGDVPARTLTIVFDGSADREEYFLFGIRAKRPCPSCDGFLAAGAVAGCCQTCSNDVESDEQLPDEDAPDHRAAAYLAAEELLDITTQLDPLVPTAQLAIDFGREIRIQLGGNRTTEADARSLVVRLDLSDCTLEVRAVPGDQDHYWWTGTRHGFTIRVVWIDHRGSDS